MGEAAEAALIGIAPGGIEHHELGAAAVFLHHLEHGFDTDAVAADVGFPPDRGVDRDHVALVADLDAVAAEEQHDHGIGRTLALSRATARSCRPLRHPR